MPTASKLLSRKHKKTIISLHPRNTALDAARLMNEQFVGCVLVMDGPDLQGIFTERDMLRRIVAEQRDPAATTLEEVMTSPVACAAPDTTLDELRTVVRNMRIRHIPVVDGRQVIGVISIGDLNIAEAETQEQTIRYLEQYRTVI